MSKEACIGSIVNGYQIIKRIFKSLIPGKSLYKVKCVLCGLISRKKLEDIKKENCPCADHNVLAVVKEEETKLATIKAKKRTRNIVFDTKNMLDSIGVERGKYVVVGYFFKDFDTDSPSMKRKTKRYIVKCRLCGSLCVMSNNNLNRSKEKRDKNITCNHKVFFDKNNYDPNDYYLDDVVLNYE